MKGETESPDPETSSIPSLETLKNQIRREKIMNVSIKTIGLAAFFAVSSTGYGAVGFNTSQLAGNLEKMAHTLEESLGRKPDSLPVFDVAKDFGADISGVQITTKQLQDAINACAKNGSGKVYFPKGLYLTGTLILKSGVNLELAEGARIIGSTDEKDYLVISPQYKNNTDRQVNKSLFYAEKVNDISITGKGIIDFQGDSPVYYPSHDNDPRRPFGIRCVSCTNVYVSGLMLLNSPQWMQHYLDCQNVMIENLNVFNHAHQNNDGMDIDGCRNVYVRNCRVDSDDDGICLKSNGPSSCENVLVENCVASSHCNALKLGTESTGGYKNILYRNCKVVPSVTGLHYINGASTARTAITLIITDGGTMENVWFDRIEAADCVTPIFVTLGNRSRKHTDGVHKPDVGRIGNVKLSNIKATGGGPMSSSITGLDKEHVISNVSLENIYLTLVSPGISKDSQVDMLKVLSKVKPGYPSPHTWGNLPSYGFYFRYVDGLQLSNVNMKLECSDPREAIVSEDCLNVVNHK
ncbi:MAG: glycosyl hydrolase family 28 protein [Luteolibacter sp.]